MACFLRHFCRTPDGGIPIDIPFCNHCEFGINIQIIWVFYRQEFWLNLCCVWCYGLCCVLSGHGGMLYSCVYAVLPEMSGFNILMRHSQYIIKWLLLFVCFKGDFMIFSLLTIVTFCLISVGVLGMYYFMNHDGRPPFKTWTQSTIGGFLAIVVNITCSKQKKKPNKCK